MGEGEGGEGGGGMETRIYRNYLNEVSLMSIFDVSLSSGREIPWKDPSSPSPRDVR